MRAQTKIDYIVQFEEVPTLIAGDASSYFVGTGLREFAIENTGNEIPVGTIEVITAEDILTDRIAGISPQLSTKWKDMHLYHGYSYCWVGAVRLKAGAMPSINAGYSRMMGD